MQLDFLFLAYYGHVCYVLIKLCFFLIVSLLLRLSPTGKSCRSATDNLQWNNGAPKISVSNPQKLRTHRVRCQKRIKVADGIEFADQLT